MERDAIEAGNPGYGEKLLAQIWPACWLGMFVMYLALKRAKVATELHVYAHGGHGFGVRKSNLPCSTWTDRCVAWLQDQGMLGTNTPAK